MELNEHKELLNRISGMCNPDNQADTNEILTNLTNDYISMTDKVEELTKQNQELTAKNERLREANTDLFLQVGRPAEKNKDTQTQVDNDVPGVTIESLFNEKGELM